MRSPRWIANLDERILGFLLLLEIENQPGRYRPCERGATLEGKKAALGFSCFALKVTYMLCEWDKLDKNRQREWITFIKSFQNTGEIFFSDSIKRNSFIDPILINYLEAENSHFSFRLAIKKLFRLNQSYSFLSGAERVIIAETKQALATLAEVGESSIKSYNSFPKTPEAVLNYMGKFNWNKPWEAGGQTAALPVFFALEASKTMPPSEIKGLQDAAKTFFKSIVDEETGGYFSGTVPGHGSLVNGAMKVLSALDWLEEPIHYPERLIDTTLKELPHSDGCHLVDAVYVLHRCLSETGYNLDKIIDYYLVVLDLIKEHHNKDGGFSYNIGSAQTDYYGLPISKGLIESDIHGTVLLSWALAMIFNLVDYHHNWEIIRP